MLTAEQFSSTNSETQGTNKNSKAISASERPKIAGFNWSGYCHLLAADRKMYGSTGGVSKARSGPWISSVMARMRRSGGDLSNERRVSRHEPLGCASIRAEPLHSGPMMVLRS